jgi:hypothetical protein
VHWQSQTFKKCNAKQKKLVRQKKGNMKQMLLPALLVFIIASCDKPVESLDYISPSIKLYQCVDTNLNGTTVQLCFDSLVQDSRCPSTATCIWQGEATVKVSLKVNGRKESFNLSTLNQRPDYRNDTTISGYNIKLLMVNPYPGSQSQDPCTIQLSVHR